MEPEVSLTALCQALGQAHSHGGDFDHLDSLRGIWREGEALTLAHRTSQRLSEVPSSILVSSGVREESSRGLKTLAALSSLPGLLRFCGLWGQALGSLHPVLNAECSSPKWKNVAPSQGLGIGYKTICGFGKLQV